MQSHVLPSDLQCCHLKSSAAIWPQVLPSDLKWCHMTSSVAITSSTQLDHMRDFRINPDDRIRSNKIYHWWRQINDICTSHKTQPQCVRSHKLRQPDLAVQISAGTESVDSWQEITKIAQISQLGRVVRISQRIRRPDWAVLNIWILAKNYVNVARILQLSHMHELRTNSDGQIWQYWIYNTAKEAVKTARNSQPGHSGWVSLTHIWATMCKFRMTHNRATVCEFRTNTESQVWWYRICNFVMGCIWNLHKSQNSTTVHEFHMNFNG